MRGGVPARTSNLVPLLVLLLATMAVNDPAGSLARLVLATVIVLWCIVAAGMLLEGLERFTSFRLLVLSGVTIGGLLWYRGAKSGGLSLVDFDVSGTGLGGAAPRNAVHISAAAPAGL